MKRILVVDDQKEIRDLLSKLFISCGYEVDTAEDGETAIKKVKGNRYDLVVTDYWMPKMNGIDLLRTLKMENSQLSIIMMSGSMVDESFLTQLGADAFLTKPLDLSNVMILAEKILKSGR